MADLCPTCHSNIGTDNTTESERAQGKQGEDGNANPVPRWTDDPLFTPRGFSGDVYSKRHNNIKKAHIKELQEARTAQETEAGIDETDFSDIDLTDRTKTTRTLIELRESTEKLLNSSGVTLEDYFKLDDDEIEQPQNPKIIDTPQTEWVDVNRGGAYEDKAGVIKTNFQLPDGETQDSPALPPSVHIRAIHIEDLRHPLIVSTPALLIHPDNGKLFKAGLSGADFKKAEEC